MGIAFFDMDKTLLTKSSGLLYVKYLLGRRLIKLDEVVNVLVISTQYSLNFLNFPSISSLPRNNACQRLCR